MAELNQKWDELQTVKTALKSAQDLYGQYVGGENELPDLVQSRLKEQYGFNKDLIGEENRLQEQLNTNRTGYGADIMESFQGDPIAAGRAVAKRAASIERRLSDIRGFRTERSGTIADIVGQITGAYQAKTARVGQQADTAQNLYNMTFQEYQQQESEAAAVRQEAEQRKQFEAQQRLAYAQLAKSGSSSGTADAEKEAKKYSYEEQKKGDRVVGFNFFGPNSQPVAPGQYFAGINGGDVDLFQMANLFKTSGNEDDRDIATIIYLEEDRGQNADQVKQTLISKYPHLGL